MRTKCLPWIPICNANLWYILFSSIYAPFSQCFFLPWKRNIIVYDYVIPSVAMSSNSELLEKPDKTTGKIFSNCYEICGSCIYCLEDCRNKSYLSVAHNFLCNRRCVHTKRQEQTLLGNSILFYNKFWLLVMILLSRFSVSYHCRRLRFDGRRYVK